MAPAAAHVGQELVLHASTVAIGTRALVIVGPSGSGKSGLALQLLACGARLIADDRTLLTASPDGPPLASCPPAIRGQVEARGIGILHVDPSPPAPVAAVVDLSREETDRLPPERTYDLLGYPVPCFHKVATPYFAAGVLQYLKGGRSPA
ncbi:MAG: HPr kinase/phosphatase C-terminal domain-containing protein [Pseudomonadota bacterium]